MADLLADVNVEGHLNRILQTIQSSEWRDLWISLGVQLHSFEELGLQPDANDFQVWSTCQQMNLVLVTANRNNDGPGSLEAVIKSGNNSTRLPVLTISNPDQILRERAYCDRVAERLFEYLYCIEALRGTGRLYLP